MKHYFLITVYSVFILFTFSFNTRSQDTSIVYKQAYFGFDSTEWKRISGRYERCQTRAEVMMRDGTIQKGQIVLVGNERMILYPGYDIIINPDLSGHFKELDMNEVSMIRVRRNTRNYEAMILAGLAGGLGCMAGGAILLWADATVLKVTPFFLGGAAAGGFLGRTMQQAPRKYNFENKNKNELISSLKNHALFGDTIQYYDDFRELVDNSKSVGRSFPVKKLRVTASIGPLGLGSGFKTNIEDVMSPEYPLNINRGRGFSPTFSFSSAYKLGSNIYIGASWSNRNIYNSYNYELSDTVSYGLNPWRLRTYKLFAEYSLLSTDRYLSNRTEILLGLGFVYAKTDQEVIWSLHDEQGGEYYNGGMLSENTKLKGCSGHILVSYHISPNTSVFTGFEGNILQKLRIPALNELSLDDGARAIDIQIPEYEINYSTINLKIGINFNF